MEEGTDSDHSEHSPRLDVLRGLSNEKRENVLHFQEISGIQDVEQCRQALEDNNWNIEAAVHSQILGEHHPIGGRQAGDADAAAAAQLQDGGAGSLAGLGLDGLRQRFGADVVGGGVGGGGGGGGGGVGGVGVGVQFQAGMDSSDDDEDFHHRHLGGGSTGSPLVTQPPQASIIHVRSTAPPLGWFSWMGHLAILPFRMFYVTVWDVFRFLLSFLRPDPRRLVTDPEGDVQRFITSFEEEYGIAPRPNFLQCSYSSALSRAKQDLKFLLVYLHGDSHEDTPEFCRNTLCESETSEYLNTNMLVWGCNINSPEGFRVSQALKEHSYPFLGLIVLGRNHRMTLVARLCGPVAPADLRSRLTELMAQNQHFLAAERADRQERLMNQSLREEQDRAYEESLRADEAKERRRRDLEDAKRLEEEAERAKELAKEEERRAVEEEKEYCRSLLAPQPEPDAPEAITLRIKLPDGKLLDRRFDRNQSTKHLYYFLLCHEDAPDDFEVKTMYPARRIQCRPSHIRAAAAAADDAMPEPPSFAEVGLASSQMILVQDNTA